MLAGLLAGLLTFAVATLIGEPQLELAIGFETAMHHGATTRWSPSWSTGERNAV